MMRARMTGRVEAAAVWTALVAVTLGLWSLAAATLPGPDYLLPPPSAVVGALADLWVKGILPVYVAESLRRILLAALLGLAVAVPVGLGLGMSRRVADFVYPLLNFFQSVSGIAWLPLVLVWFGFGERTILVAVCYTVFFPVIFNAFLGVRSVPRIYVDALGFMIFSAQTFHLTARIMLGMGVIGLLWMLLEYFLLRPLEEATIARWGLV